jgi:hypothetical protein
MKKEGRNRASANTLKMTRCVYFRDERIGRIVALSVRENQGTYCNSTILTHVYKAILLFSKKLLTRVLVKNAGTSSPIWRKQSSGIRPVSLLSLRTFTQPSSNARSTSTVSPETTFSSSERVDVNARWTIVRAPATTLDTLDSIDMRSSPLPTSRNGSSNGFMERLDGAETAVMVYPSGDTGSWSANGFTGGFKLATELRLPRSVAALMGGLGKEKRSLGEKGRTDMGVLGMSEP